MTILDLIKRTAVIFNIESILKDVDLNDLNNNTQSSILTNNEQLNRMFELSKVVLSEVYAYASKEIDVKVTSANKRIDKNLLGEVAKIVSVRNDGGRVDFTINDNDIVVAQDGEYVVKCIVAPNVKYLTNEVDMLNGNITEDLLINGLGAYYCLTVGLFEEYNVYNTRYIDGFSKLRNPKLFAMPCRSWNE